MFGQSLASADRTQGSARNKAAPKMRKSQKDPEMSRACRARGYIETVCHARQELHTSYERLTTCRHITGGAGSEAIPVTPPKSRIPSCARWGTVHGTAARGLVPLRIHDRNLYQKREIVRPLLSITGYVSSALGSYPREAASAKDRSMCVTRASNELCTVHVQSMRARCVRGAATAVRESNHGK
ncbi:hypothetical protein B0G80_6262 [Paraburkholderia sp. BL6669N2]|nr:hypothetical protein B0G80_6262 [Paraburkholderia sp. BL6669N2]